MRREDVLVELTENLVDNLNFEDAEVGISFFDNLKEFVEFNSEDLEGVEFKDVTEKRATVLCEGYSFDLYLKAFNADEPEYAYEEWVIE